MKGKTTYFRNLNSWLSSILIIIHLIIILMMRDQQHKDDTCHDVEFLSKLHKMTIENTIKDMFEVRGEVWIVVIAGRCKKNL